MSSGRNGSGVRIRPLFLCAENGSETGRYDRNSLGAVDNRPFSAFSLPVKAHPEADTRCERLEASADP